MGLSGEAAALRGKKFGFLVGLTKHQKLEYGNRPPICKLFVPEKIDYEGKEYYMDTKMTSIKKKTLIKTANA